jgi:multiple sugar transport system ATP-binding protein
MATSIELRQLKKAYGDVHVIHGVDLTIEPGDFTVFVGPSGCGKSTLLRMIAGLEPITGGDLLIDGQRMNEVPAAKRGIAMVFQSYALYPHMSVYQNLAFGLETAKMPKAEIEKRVQRAAEILKIEPLLKRKPKQADSANALPSAAPSCANQRSSFSTNPCRTSMRNCASPCASRSPSFTRILGTP